MWSKQTNQDVTNPKKQKPISTTSKSCEISLIDKKKKKVQLVDKT